MKSLLYLGPNGRRLWQNDRDDWHAAADAPAGPVWVVTDFAEEAFVEIEMPRLFGRDRAAYIARQLSSRFPDTPYRAALGPLQGGGAMDRLAPSSQIFLAINNAERLNAELGALPIAGVWPISLLLALFCHSRKLPGELLVVLPHPEALRIVYLKKHTPVLTRLAPTSTGVSAQVEEIVRTRRYLENTRIIERGQPCPVLLLGAVDEFAAPLTAAQFELVPPPHPWDRQPPADWLFPLFDLALKSPAGQVAPVSSRTVFLAGQLRRWAYAISAACLVVSLYTASGNLSAILDTLRLQNQSQNNLRELAASIAGIDQKITAFGVDPELLRRIIALDDEEIVSVPGFASQVKSLAQVLSEIPELRLKKLEWQLLPTDGKPCNKAAALTPATGAPPASGDSGENKAERLVELGIDLALPDSQSPGAQAQLLRRISQQLGKIEGCNLLQDPAREIDQGTLQSNKAASTAAASTHSWCLSLPGNTRSAQKAERRGSSQ